jgi:hypothetical protein
LVVAGIIKVAAALFLAVLTPIVPAAADEAPAGTPAPPPPNADPTKLLLGDIGGLRSELTKRGIIPAATEIDEFLGNVSGGVRQGLIYEGLTDVSLAYDFRPAISVAGKFLRPRVSDPRQGADRRQYRQFEHGQWNRGDRHDTFVRTLVRAAYWRLAANTDWPAKRQSGISGHHRGQALRQLGLWLADFAGHGFTVRRPELSAGAQTSTPDNHTFSRRICPIG